MEIRDWKLEIRKRSDKRDNGRSAQRRAERGE